PSLLLPFSPSPLRSFSASLLSASLLPPHGISVCSSLKRLPCSRLADGSSSDNRKKSAGQSATPALARSRLLTSAGKKILSSGFRSRYRSAEWRSLQTGITRFPSDDCI